ARRRPRPRGRAPPAHRVHGPSPGAPALPASPLPAIPMTAFRFLLLSMLLAPAAFAQTWSAQTSGTANDLNNAFARSATEAYAAGDNGTLLRTTDGGTTWTQLPVGGFDLEGAAFNPNGTVGTCAAASGQVP